MRLEETSIKEQNHSCSKPPHFLVKRTCPVVNCYLKMQSSPRGGHIQAKIDYISK